MQIQYFAADQNLVFVPALLALLAATVLICLPIVFAPAVRRSKRRAPLLALVVVLAVVALVGTVVLALPGFRTLGAERSAVRSGIERDYGLQITDGEANELVNGGRPARTLPEVATQLRLPKPTKPHALRLVPEKTGSDVYALTFGGEPYPR